MAAGWDESSLDLSEFDIKAVIRLQAQFRGWLTRKELKDVQSEFLEVVAEMDGPTVQVDWTVSSLPRPLVHRASKQSRRSNRKQDTEHALQQGPMTNRPRQAGTATEGTSENDGESSRLGSVPVQTHQEVQTDKLQVRWSMQEADSNRQDGEETPRSSVHATEHQSEDRQRKDFSTGSDGVQVQGHALGRPGMCGDGGDSGLDKAVDDSDDRVKARGEVKPRGDMTADQTRAEKHSNDGDTPPATDTSTPSVSLIPPSSDPTLSGSWTPTQVPAVERMRGVESFHGDQTSVWDSSSSIVQDHETASKKVHRHQSGHHASDLEAENSTVKDDTNAVNAELRSFSTEALSQQRQSVAMELLWVQQAIISRKKYLKLKTQMEVAT